MYTLSIATVYCSVITAGLIVWLIQAHGWESKESKQCSTNGSWEFKVISNKHSYCSTWWQNTYLLSLRWISMKYIPRQQGRSRLSLACPLKCKQRFKISGLGFYSNRTEISLLIRIFFFRSGSEVPVTWDIERLSPVVEWHWADAICKTAFILCLSCHLPYNHLPSRIRNSPTVGQ